MDLVTDFTGPLKEPWCLWPAYPVAGFSSKTTAAAAAGTTGPEHLPFNFPKRDPCALQCLAVETRNQQATGLHSVSEVTLWCSARNFISLLSGAFSLE